MEKPMFEGELKWVVVEDTDQHRKEVVSLLIESGFDADNLLGSPTRYDEALELISSHSAKIDVVFLDLRIPRDEVDSEPEKRVGGGLLDVIHSDLNRRSGNDIRVVIVSGEELLDGLSDKTLYKSYPDTLVSIAQKSSLERTLKASVKRLRRTPMITAFRRGGLGSLIDPYLDANDVNLKIRDRLECAREVALRLVRNEFDQHVGRPDASSRFSGDLHSLLNEIESTRFRAEAGRARVKQGDIITDGGWGDFLWRGVLFSHLRTLNGLRNDFVHLDRKPYRPSDGSRETWSVPADVLQDLESGRWTGQVAAAILDEILAMYLPWHQEVYVKWLESKS
jgi:hypothetical protein